MKKLPLGIALILFGILLELADIWIPVIGNSGAIGLVFGIIGLIFAIVGCFEKKQ